MSTPDPTAVVKKPLSWAKASPLVFGILLLIVIVLAIRFRHTLAGWISKIPFGIGPWLVGTTAQTAAAPPVTQGP